MPDLKISQLPPLPQATVASADELAIVDKSASETKKVTAGDLVIAGLSLAPNSSIPWGKVDSTGMTLPVGVVTSTSILDGAVGTADIADGAVTSQKITGPIALDKLGSQAAGVVLAGPVSGVPAASAFRSIVPSDLPKATTGAAGIVQVDAAGGIAVDTNGVVSLSPTVTAGSNPVVTYNSTGQVTSGRALQPGDLPIATATTLGAVSIGTGLTVDAAGKVATNLAAAQIPDLDASKITSGEFPTARIAHQSITGQQLADYAITYIQEAIPPTTAGAQHIGTLWFQESTAKLSMWNGNSWMPVGQGSLSAENLRFCGTFDASTGLITAITQFGTAAGLTSGSAIPAATDQLTGVYLVCDTAGTYDTKTFDAGDWILCMGQARGWDRIDTLSGGGGGAAKLGDLVDVTITTPTDGQVLSYNGTNWVNGNSPDPGTY